MVVLDPAHLVGIGGAIGAVFRYLVSERVAIEAFPVGTLTVNVLGTFVLGFVTFLGADAELLLLIGTGACGSFTTFSSFSFETVRLWETGERPRAVLNGAANLVGAFVALGFAWALVAVLG